MAKKNKNRKRLSNKSILRHFLPVIISSGIFLIIVTISNHYYQKNKKNPPIINDLIDLLKKPSEDIHVKASTIQAMGKIGNKKAARAIIDQMDGNPYLLEVGTAALKNIDVDLDYNEILARPPIEDKIWSKGMFESLKNFFNIKDPGSALSILIFYVVPALISYIIFNKITTWGIKKYYKKKSESDVGKRKAENAKPYFNILLVAGVVILCSIHYLKSFKEPITTSTPSDYQVKLIKVEYAGKQRDPRSISMLSEILLDSSENLELRWRAAYSLGRIGEKRTEAVLRNTLVDTNSIVRQYVVWAIGNINAKGEFFENSAVPLITRFCPNCGEAVHSNDNFCRNCHYNLERTFENNSKSK